MPQRGTILLIAGCVSVAIAAIVFFANGHFEQIQNASVRNAETGISASLLTGTTSPKDEPNTEPQAAGEALPIRDLIVFKERDPVDLSGYPEDYEALKGMALDGDVWAAFVLADWLGLCEHTAPPRSRADLSEEIDRFQQTHTVESYSGGETQYMRIDVVVGTADVTSAVVQSMIDKFERCNHVSTETRQESEQWLAFAIELERNPTFLLKLAHGKSDDVAEALYIEAWNKGASGALLQLYRTYQARYETGEVPTNDVRAFAHFLAWSEIERARKIRLGQPANILNRLFDQQVNRARLKLSEYESMEAEALARKLIVENENCCFISTRSSQ